ncbi:MAG: acyl-CoA dehydrogenase family protein [Nitrospiraceae bacterium]
MTTYRELDVTLTPEQQALKKHVHEFAKSVLRPTAVALDRLPDPQQVIDQDSPLWAALKAGYAQGVHTALIPKPCGGMGLGGLSLHLALEELGWGSADFAASLAISGFPFAMVAATGKDDLIEEWVKPFVADKEARYVGCWAITEPDHGSDQFMAGTAQFCDPKISGQVTAWAEGPDYLITGQKSAWVSNGTIATHALTYLTLDPSKGMAGGGVAFIPLNLPGVSKGEPLDKMGQRALNQGSITFTNVRIPKRYMLFDATSYEAILHQTLVLTNGAMGAVFTGVAQAAYDQALAYTKTRLQGGKPISEHQLVQKHLFNMFTKVEASRALSRAAMVYNATAQPPALEYSIAAKVYCTQACLEVTDTALQLFGGKGLTRDCPIEKLYRDARASLIEDGVNDVLALVGARKLLADQMAV